MPQLRSVMVVPLLVLCAACASVPPEAPTLSVQLGERISAIESAHLALLHTYFDERRDRIDEFVTREWLPVFAEELFKGPAVAAAWDEVVASGDPAERLQFILLVGPRVQASLNAKRQELQQPLTEVERAMERRLNAEYAQARAMNASLTSFLVSTSELEATRNRYLASFGVEPSEIAAAIDEADGVVASLLSGASTGQSLLTTGQEYAEKLRTLARRLNAGGRTP